MKELALESDWRWPDGGYGEAQSGSDLFNRMECGGGGAFDSRIDMLEKEPLK